MKTIHIAVIGLLLSSALSVHAAAGPNSSQRTSQVDRLNRVFTSIPVSRNIETAVRCHAAEGYGRGIGFELKSDRLVIFCRELRCRGRECGSPYLARTKEEVAVPLFSLKKQGFTIVGGQLIDSIAYNALTKDADPEEAMRQVVINEETMLSAIVRPSNDREAKVRRGMALEKLHALEKSLGKQ